MIDIEQNVINKICLWISDKSSRCRLYYWRIFGGFTSLFATLEVLIDHLSQSAVMRKKKDFALKRITSCACLVMLQKCFWLSWGADFDWHLWGNDSTQNLFYVLRHFVFMKCQFSLNWLVGVIALFNIAVKLHDILEKVVRFSMSFIKG